MSCLVIFKPVDLIEIRKTDCFGETRLSCLYLAHQELSDFIIFIITVIIIIMSRLVMATCHVAEECACTQGDEEAKLQLPVTPMCDRRSVIVSTNQLRFIQFLLKVMHSLCYRTCSADFLSQYGFVEWSIFCMSTLFAMD
jgi:hypothetical protein